MTDSLKVTKPQIVVYVLPHPEAAAKRGEVQAGMEEEGIPGVFSVRENGDTTHLSFQAATASQLGVGIAIGPKELCIHFERLPEDRPLFRLAGAASPEDWRGIGCNAARLVKGVPFKLPPAGERQETNKDDEITPTMIEQIASTILQQIRLDHGR
jgi:hypothetical protein